MPWSPRWLAWPAPQHAWTLAGLGCGCGALLVCPLAATGESGTWLRLAAMLVLAAAVCDGVDGAVARRRHAADAFGAQLESLADLVSFGAAPALMVWVLPARAAGSLAAWMAASAILLYVMAAAWRLARFGVPVATRKRKKDGARSFRGLPVTAAGATLAAWAWTQAAHPAAAAAGPVSFLLLGALAALMISALRYPHLGPWVQDHPRAAAALAVPVVVALALLEPGAVLLAVATAYLAIPLVRPAWTRALRMHGAR